MDIAFIKSTPHIATASGVKIQALEWKTGLEKQGHNITLINCWENIDWARFDILLFFEYDGYLRQFIELTKNLKAKIALAPIIDANATNFQFKLACKFLGCEKLRLRSKFHDLYIIRNCIDMYYVRSEYEKKYITKSLGIKDNKVTIVPLSYRIIPSKENILKENFCFHLSRPADKGKNVPRLIKAAKKYNIPLIIAGGVKDDNERNWLMSLISDAPNIKYVGYLNEQELYSYYKKAKVFALPSIYEGVGMAALEAAVLGCEIVITKLGGPKEYFNNMAEIVNPYDIDEIGESISKLLNNNKSYQPQLSDYIINHYNTDTCISILNSSLRKIMNCKLPKLAY